MVRTRAPPLPILRPSSSRVPHDHSRVSPKLHSPRHCPSSATHGSAGPPPLPSPPELLLLVPPNWWLCPSSAAPGSPKLRLDRRLATTTVDSPSPQPIPPLRSLRRRLNCRSPPLPLLISTPRDATLASIRPRLSHAGLRCALKCQSSSRRCRWELGLCFLSLSAAREQTPWELETGADCTVGRAVKDTEQRALAIFG
jgi:hypothetical protein